MFLLMLPPFERSENRWSAIVLKRAHWLTTFFYGAEAISGQCAGNRMPLTRIGARLGIAQRFCENARAFELTLDEADPATLDPSLPNPATS